MPKKTVAGITYEKADSWSEEDLTGEWTAYIKVDGIRTIGFKDDLGFISRSGKPLLGLNKNATAEARDKLLKYGDCEVYSVNWNKSSSLCRSESGTDVITDRMIYPLKDEDIEDRLFLGKYDGMTADQIIHLRDQVCMDGYEGLILRGRPPRARSDKWIRVKPHVTGEVFIRKMEEAVDKDTGEGLGRVGVVHTDYGKVGIFKDMDHAALTAVWEDYCRVPFEYEDTLMQVQFMEWTVHGKMRHAKWDSGIIRWDKDEESFDKPFVTDE